MNSAAFMSNPLLDLKKVQSGDLGRLLDGSRQLETVVDQFVAQPILPRELLDAVWDRYRAGKETLSADVRGALGFCVLVEALDLAAHGVPTEIDVAALIEDDEVTSTLLRWYRYHGPKLEFDPTHPAVTGTTSFILRCEDTGTNEAQALKLLLPRYVDSATIGERTNDYEAWLDGVPHTPLVRDSKPRYIRMQWVSDATLAAFDELLPAASTSQSATFIQSRGEFLRLRDFAVALLQILREFDRLRVPRHPSGLRHLDLSPTNIFVAPRRAAGYELTLIDFGVNFLINEKTGTTRALSAASLYIAPEVRLGARLASAHDERRADLYSAGMLFMQVLSRNSVGPENQSALLRDTWENAPGWARIVEELIVEDPQRRCSLQPSRYDDPYSYVLDLVTQEDKAITIFASVKGDEAEVADGPDSAGAPRLLKWHRVRSFNDFIKIWRAASARIVGEEYPRSLGVWAAISIAWWIAMFLTFVDLTLADFGASTPVAEILKSTFGGHLRFGIGPEPHHHWRNLGRNFPGRIVGLTFGMCAVAYYVNIFSTLSLRGLRRTRLAEFFMRSTAWFPGFPIAVLMFVDPQWWPYMSFAGAVVVICNNFFVSRLIARSKSTEDEDRGPRAAETRLRNEAFRQVFVEWWKLMVLYGGFLLLTGLLVSLHWIPATWYFALVVAFGVNYVKMYRLNSVKETPKIRGNLQRAVYVLRARTTPTGLLRALHDTLDALGHPPVRIQGATRAATIPPELVPRVVEAVREFQQTTVASVAEVRLTELNRAGQPAQPTESGLEVAD
jgi:hypothetical protein